MKHRYQSKNVRKRRIKELKQTILEVLGIIIFFLALGLIGHQQYEFDKQFEKQIYEMQQHK